MEQCHQGKKYTIEAPIYSDSMECFAEVNRIDNIGVILYGGVPDSPLNGGRPNFMLDGIFLFDRLFLRLTRKQLSKLTSRFYDTVTSANQNNIPFFVTLTNIFIEDEELTEENLYPLQFLVESSQKYGVKNGVILNNKRLEEAVRQRHGDRLVYTSSCTKYFWPHKILSPLDTQNMYQEDSGKYDYIVLTPQDSQRKRVIKNVMRSNKSGIVAVCNVFCSTSCNSYGHYELFSRLNKKSLLTIRPAVDLACAVKFGVSKIFKCPYARTLFFGQKIKANIELQLQTGVTNFKLARLSKVPSIGTIVSLIQEYENKKKKEQQSTYQ
jgi:hypothetical protein